MNRHTCKSLQNARGKGIPRLEISITGCDCFTDIPPNAAYDAVFNPSIRRPRDPSEDLFGDSHLNSYLRFDEATEVFFLEIVCHLDHRLTRYIYSSHLRLYFYKHEMADKCRETCSPFHLPRQLLALDLPNEHFLESSDEL